jgi:hypothetical protein
MGDGFGKLGRERKLDVEVRGRVRSVADPFIVAKNGISTGALHADHVRRQWW